MSIYMFFKQRLAKSDCLRNDEAVSSHLVIDRPTKVCQKSFQLALGQTCRHLLCYFPRHFLYHCQYRLYVFYPRLQQRKIKRCLNSLTLDVSIKFYPLRNSLVRNSLLRQLLPYIYNPQAYADRINFKLVAAYDQEYH